jgi:hypothetical protein
MDINSWPLQFQDDKIVMGIWGVYGRGYLLTSCVVIAYPHESFDDRALYNTCLIMLAIVEPHILFCRDMKLVIFWRWLIWTCDTYREIGMSISCGSYERTFCVVFWPLVTGPLQTVAARCYFRVRTTACWVSGHHLLNNSYGFPHRSSVLGCQLFHMKVHCCKVVTLQLSLRMTLNYASLHFVKYTNRKLL